MITPWILNFHRQSITRKMKHILYNTWLRYRKWPFWNLKKKSEVGSWVPTSNFFFRNSVVLKWPIWFFSQSQKLAVDKLSGTYKIIIKFSSFFGPIIIYTVILNNSKRNNLLLLNNNRRLLLLLLYSYSNRSSPMTI